MVKSSPTGSCLYIGASTIADDAFSLRFFLVLWSALRFLRGTCCSCLSPRFLLVDEFLSCCACTVLYAPFSALPVPTLVCASFLTVLCLYLSRRAAPLYIYIYMCVYTYTIFYNHIHTRRSY